MSKLKLIYFDFDGGRGGPVRMALSFGAVEYEDDRVSREDWPNLKPRMPFGSLPVLEVDGRALTQSNTINRYIGKLAGLYPTDAWQAALCDEVMDAIEDISQKVGVTFSMADEDEKRAAREALAEGPIPVYLKRFEACLAERGGEYFADGRLTVADLKMYFWIRHLLSGALDYIPKDIVEQYAPSLVKHFERVKDYPGLHA